MRTVITKITVETKGPGDLITDEFMEQYKQAVYELIKSETDVGAKIEVSVEVE